MTIILNALRDGQYQLALALIQNALPYQISQTNKEGQTALHLAIQKNLIPIARALLEKGANVNALAKDLSYAQMTPLHYAALTGNLAGTKLLLEFVANVHLENSRFQTAASIAHQHGFIEVAHLIEKRMYHFVKYSDIRPLPQVVKPKALAFARSPLIENKVIDFVAYKKNRLNKI